MLINSPQTLPCSPLLCWRCVCVSDGWSPPWSDWLRPGRCPACWQFGAVRPRHRGKARLPVRNHFPAGWGEAGESRRRRVTASSPFPPVSRPRSHRPCLLDVITSGSGARRRGDGCPLSRWTGLPPLRATLGRRPRAPSGFVPQRSAA
ncbi:hypothetical protein BU14_0442s0005 [Porphyra umbilicalis]|uniref:Uncharacterized protein n=1 Tax=Porphyra umbilicalis TaxID=2786 RepID=A0A1X6NV44_PORUM|nr:hypothetical protein BU14_0442s0005 [Porphyra umbilicalis]|eukprot:OSX72370.1 hypothetical protein BU14_0442s0005 [Porphyra umbilicalis]